MISNRYQFRAVREWSNQEIRKIAPFCKGDIVNVSAGDDEDKEGNYYKDYFLNAKSYSMTNWNAGEFRGYKERENEYLLDLTSDLPDSYFCRFDVVLNHTTLEHIFPVQKAFLNLTLITRDLLLLIVPFSQAQHETISFKDYWRFTPSCIRELMHVNDLHVIYEAESPYINSSIYLFVVGTKQPEKWKDILPQYKDIECAGSWIGRSKKPKVSVLQKIVKFLIK